MLQSYIPILVLIAVVLGFVGVNLMLSELVSRRRVNVGKLEAYECGMAPVGSARLRL